jgi:hypothetical protein
VEDGIFNVIWDYLIFQNMVNVIRVFLNVCDRFRDDAGCSLGDVGSLGDFELVCPKIIE